MTMLMVDPEFENLIPKLGAKELAGLEANLELDGCLDPILTWNGIILDGHNRHRICARLGIEYAVREIQLQDRGAARVWILEHQLGRRNLTDAARIDLALLLKTECQRSAQERRKATQGRPRKDAPKLGPNLNPVSRADRKTNSELAKMAGVSKSTVGSFEKLKKAGTPELVAATKEGRVSISTAAAAAEVLTPEEQTTAVRAAKPGEALRAAVESKRVAAAVVDGNGAPPRRAFNFMVLNSVLDTLMGMVGPDESVLDIDGLENAKRDRYLHDVPVAARKLKAIEKAFYEWTRAGKKR